METLPKCTCGLYALLFTLAFLHQSHAQQSETGIVGESLVLRCPLATSNSNFVKWADYIHNNDRDPALIFDSTGNPSMAIETSHPMSENFLVQADYSLKFLSLSTDDYGQYVCDVDNDGDVQRITFQVSAIAMPDCPQSVSGKVGTSVDVRCSMEYGSNETPHMGWYSPDNVLVTSKDETDIRILIKVVTVEMRMEDNGLPYVCKAGLQSRMNSCQTFLDVQYDAEDIVITPMKDTYRVNDRITCQADANPPPRITWYRNNEEISIGEGSNELVVREEYMLEENTFRCDAQSSANSILSSEIMFQALEAPPQPDPTEPSEVGQPGASSGQVSSATVIGAVVAVLLVIIIIAIIVCVIRRRNDKSKKGDAEVANGGTKQIPQKDPDVKNDIGEKGSPNHVGLYDPETRPKTRQFSPAPSDPRHRQSEEYQILMNQGDARSPGNQGDNNNVIWQKNNGINDSQYASIQRA